MMGRRILLVIIYFIQTDLHAQYLAKPLKNDFKDIPRVEVRIYDSTLLKQKLNLAFTTLDSKLAMGRAITDPSSFQIVSATTPFPPKVFLLTDQAQNKAGENYLLQDFRNHYANMSSMYVNFHDSKLADLDAYFIMKKDANGRYQVVDTFGSNDYRSVDGHSFVVDEKGNYWFLTYQYHKYDMSYRTKDIRDTGAAILTTKVEIWNPASSKSVFELDLWEKGLLQIDSIPMNVIEKDEDHLTYDVAHANSWLPLGDIDGCPIGMLSDLMDGVKFIRLCDSTVLRYGASMPDFKPLDTSDHHLYLQHDFKIIKEGPYKGYFTCFSDGSGPNYTYRSARVPILKFDFKAKTVKLIHEFSFPEIYSKGRGNVDFSGDYVLVNFGIEKSKFAGVRNDPKYTDNAPNWIIRNLTTDRVSAEYFLPACDHSYNVWFMKDEQISRPSITVKGNKLLIDSARWSDPLWSTGETSNVIEPLKNGSYYVTVNGGGLFRFVSDEITFTALPEKKGTK